MLILALIYQEPADRPLLGVVVMRKKLHSREGTAQVDVPEAYIIEKLEEAKNESYDRDQPVIPWKSGRHDLPYWPHPDKKPNEGVVIIDL